MFREMGKADTEVCTVIQICSVDAPCSQYKYDRGLPVQDLQFSQLCR